jgi:hypothetical protein
MPVPQGGTASGGSSGGSVPTIVVVSAPPPEPQIRQPVIVINGSRRYRSSFSIFGSLFTLLVIFGVCWYAMRIRNNVASGIHAAERAAEHAAERVPSPAEHKKK